MRTMHIAVVGLGGIARTHIDALRRLPDVRLHTLVTRRPAEVEAEARAMGFATVTADLATALANPAVVAVDICTPNALHADAALAAFAAGKAVYCEKPLAASEADAERMVAGAAAAGLVEQVALVYRYHPAVIRIKALLEQMIIGDLLQFRATFNHSGYLNADAVKGWRSRSALSGGGGLIDLGVHVIDIMNLLLGPMTLTHSSTRTLVRRRAIEPGGSIVDVDVDDWALLEVTSPGGVPGVIETSRIALGNEGLKLELYGTRGSIICDLTREMSPSVRTFTGPPVPMPEHLALQYLPPAEAGLGWVAAIHQAGLNHFLQRLAGKDPTPGWAPTFAEAMAAERLVYQALRA